MEVSVIICTYNRCGNLPACIDCLAGQEEVANLDWQIVVVDNNSTDDTAATMEKLARFSPVPILYLFERKQGLSHARNRGIRETDSRYLAFIDDDIRVSPLWLRSICRAFQQQDCDAVGGRIRIDSPAPIPSWIRPDMYGFLGHRDFGGEPFQMDGIRQFPFGGNMAFHRRVIEKIGLFDTDMGRKGSGEEREHLFKGEEVDYFHRLAKAGGTFYYQPEAVVSHRILPYQLKKPFFRMIHYNSGYLKAIRDQAVYHKKIYGIPPFLFHQLTRQLAKYFYQSATKGIEFAFRQQMTVSYFLGMMIGYARKQKKTRADQTCVKTCKANSHRRPLTSVRHNSLPGSDV
jgi:glycosyltransferase involved in cell wall biosynthesis